jgi:Tol biopolymer transport system component
MRQFVLAVCLTALWAAATPQTAPASLQTDIVQITDTANCGSEYPAFDAGGNRLVFESNCDHVTGGNGENSSEVFAMNADGSRIRQLTSGDGFIGNVGVDASGRTIVFATGRDLVGENADGNGEIFIMDIDGGNLRQLTHTTGANEHGTAHYLPTLDYSGRRVFFTSIIMVDGQPTNATRINVVNSDGTGFAPFTSGDADGGPSLDARGNVYFVGTGASKLYRARRDGSGVVQIGPDDVLANGNEKTSVDAAGSRLAFTSEIDLIPGGNADHSREVFLLDIETGAITQVTSTVGPGLGCRTASLSASGRTVVFSCDGNLTGANADGNRELFVANVR